MTFSWQERVCGRPRAVTARKMPKRCADELISARVHRRSKLNRDDRNAKPAFGGLTLPMKCSDIFQPRNAPDTRKCRGSFRRIFRVVGVLRGSFSRSLDFVRQDLSYNWSMQNAAGRRCVPCGVESIFSVSNFENYSAIRIGMLSEICSRLTMSSCWMACRTAATRFGSRPCISGRTDFHKLS